MNRSDDVVSALLKCGAMSVYEKVFDVLGPCELWPEDVIDAMCQPVCSRTVEVIAKFCFEGGLPCNLLQDVLRDLPFESAPQDQIAYAKGLYEKWRADADLQQTIKELDWCAPLERFAGTISTWPEEVLQSLRSEESDATLQCIGEWAYFHSVPLDDLLDVLYHLPGATGDVRCTLLLRTVYEDMFKVDAGLTEALEAAVRSVPDLLSEREDDVIVIDDDGSGPAEHKEVRPTSPPLVTIVEDPGASTSTSQAPQDDTTGLVVGPDLSRPEVLGRLGLGYVASTLARPDQDPFDTAWKVMLRRLGAPRTWPLDIRQCLAGRVDRQNVIVVASFAFMNGVKVDELCEFLFSRPQGIDNNILQHIRVLYEMWQNPTRGHHYRQQRFAFNLRLQRYLDLNLNESNSPLAKLLQRKHFPKYLFCVNRLCHLLQVMQPDNVFS